MANTTLSRARAAKKDEFYTQLADIEQELKHYRPFFAGKTVLCNCDDPYESNFFKFFALHFNDWKLKRLISICYDNSPVAGTQLEINFHSDDGAAALPFAPDITVKTVDDARPQHEQKPYKIDITQLPDLNGDKSVDLKDVVELARQNEKYNSFSQLAGRGDFRSPDCEAILREADVVVTNPPFSLFREFVAQLVKFDKKFLIIGNQNAITYKEIFPLIKDNRMWLGPSITSGDRKFNVPKDYPLRAATCGTDADGHKFIRVKGVRWFTNIDHKRRHEPLILYKHYTPEEFPHYDNYDAINVDRTADIPMDYDGAMGVPITFMDKYCPEQFEIIGNEYDLNISKGRGYVNGKRKYSRIFIRRRI